MRFLKKLIGLWYVIIPALAFISIMYGFAITAFVPFAPYHFYGFKEVPQEVCANDPVQVLIDRKIDTGYNVEYPILVEGFWLSKNGVTVGDASAPVPPRVGERTLLPSSVYRYAPNIPNEYQLGYRIFLRGETYLIPRNQRGVWHSKQFITVLSTDDEKCLSRDTPLKVGPPKGETD